MQWRSVLVTAIVAGLLGTATSGLHANGVGSLAEVRVIDRTTGETLPIYAHQGRRYVAGAPGNRYAIAIRNRSGARVLTVVSVDGVNAVSGETAAWDQNGYVFAPGQQWEIRGWRKSQDRVAAFEFTSLANSYAARTGRPDHVGVIGVAVFREAVRVAPPAPAAAPRQESSRDASQDANTSVRAAKSGADSPAGPQPDAASGAPLAERRRDEGRLGTGHGRSESSWVSYTDFERARPTPDELITIHYDSRENLIALGVIPSPARPLPFPGSGGALGFVPDPPR